MKQNGKNSRLAILLLASPLLALAQSDANLAENEGPPRNARISITVSTPPASGPFAFAHPARSSGAGSGGSFLAAGPADAADAPPPSMPVTPPPVVETDSPTSAPPAHGPVESATRSDSAKTETETGLTPAATAAQIRAVTFAERAPVIADVESRLDAATQFVAHFRNRTEELHGDARTQFQAALDQARQRAAQVRTSLRNLTTIAPEKFVEARAQLAGDYEAYAEAFAHVERTGSVAQSEKR